MTLPTLRHNAALLLLLITTSVLLGACGGGDEGAIDALPARQSNAVAIEAAARSTAQEAPDAQSASLEDTKGTKASAQEPATAPEPAAPTMRALAAGSQTTLTLRARGDLAGGVGPLVSVRLNGASVGLLHVSTTTASNYTLQVSALNPGDKLDIAFINDAQNAREDRNLELLYVSAGGTLLVPSQAGVILDHGNGVAAFDGINTEPGRARLSGNGALRFTWPQASIPFTNGEAEASRFLHQATFGPTRTEVSRLAGLGLEAWLNEQIAMPATPAVLEHVQRKFDLGPDHRPPNGRQYLPDWVGQRFWHGAATGQDQLRKRAAFALQQIFVASQADSNLYWHARAYAHYVDTLNRLAFGNYRVLLEEVALSPVMGIYLSHMRNQKEDPSANRLPDENFAREIMQLFSIGLHELNPDGSPKRDASGRPIETYSNADVMAMAKVFTGWSWGYDDAALTEHNFRWGTPSSADRGAAAVDTRRMKPYPGQTSTAEKTLFRGKPHAVTIPAGASAQQGLRLALDALANHPNVGPFIGRQLIQRLVTSNPSPAYIKRVAQTFDNNGRGVRGDLGAVIKAVLLDPEARAAPTASSGKIREPVLRVSNWMRAFKASSASGEFLLTNELLELGQKPHHMPSVFNFFRPSYVPPNTVLSQAGMVAPEMQTTDESTVAAWINRLEVMLREGMGWWGARLDVTIDLRDEAAMVARSPMAFIEHLNLLLFSGNMSATLRMNILEAMLGVPDTANNRDQLRAKAAIFIAMASPEFMVQR